MKFSTEDFYSKFERNLKTEENLNGKLYFFVQCSFVPLKGNKGQRKPRIPTYWLLVVLRIVVNPLKFMS